MTTQKSTRPVARRIREGLMMGKARTCDPERMNVERLFARLFVVAGGVFWTIAFFMAGSGYGPSNPMVSARNALLPLILTVATLLVGWFFERLAAAGLLIGVAAVGVWGVVAAWEAGVWMLMLTTLVAPMIVSAALFLLAAREQRACALEPSPSTAR